MSVLSLNGKGINETNELDCLRELVLQGGDEIGTPLTDTQLRATPVPVSGQPVTPNFDLLGASDSRSIPVGAKGWTATILTGTGTIGGLAVPAGFSDGDPNTLLAAINVTTDGGSSAYVRWNT